MRIKTESPFIMCTSVVTCIFYCLRLTISKLLYLFVVTTFDELLPHRLIITLGQITILAAVPSVGQCQ